MTAILSAIQGFIPHLSPKTLTLLRAQLPRPRMTKKLLAPAMISSEEQRQKLDHDYEEMASRRAGGAGPQNIMWSQGAWQMLALMQTEVGILVNASDGPAKSRRPT